jgi:hypothetical protein
LKFFRQPHSLPVTGSEKASSRHVAGP